jgi:ribosomal protein S27AE
MVETSPRKEVPTVNIRSVSCPNCGASVTIRSFGQAVNVVCGSCHAILDAQDPNVQILQKFSAAMKFHPLIPLGSRGKLRGTR